MVMEGKESLARRIWKFTFAKTSAIEFIINATLAMKRVFLNFIKASYASLVSVPPTILFEYL